MTSLAEEVDALIIGGGPAGLAAAIVLARAGVHTLLCEKGSFPVDKACGEGVMPTGWSHLQELGVAHLLDKQNCTPIAGIRYVSPSGRVAVAPFAEGPGRGIRRTALSASLWQVAGALSALRIEQETAAEPLGRVDGGVLVRAGRRRVRARLLIGADGRHSRVRRWAGLDGRPAKRQRWGVRRHVRLRPWNDTVDVHWSDEGVEAYVTPCGEEQVNVAFLWDKVRCRRVRGGEGLFPSLLPAFPRLQARLDGAAPLSAVRAVGPLAQPVRRTVADNVLLVGDAAGYLDAITGEGISLALSAALSLEETVAPLLRRGKAPLVSELAAYERRHQALYRPYHQLTALVLWLSRFPRLAEWAVRTLEQEPAAFQHLLSANMGLASPWAPAVWMRLFRGFGVAVRQSASAGAAAS